MVEYQIEPASYVDLISVWSGSNLLAILHLLSRNNEVQTLFTDHSQIKGRCVYLKIESRASFLAWLNKLYL